MMYYFVFLAAFLVIPNGSYSSSISINVDAKVEEDNDGKDCNNHKKAPPRPPRLCPPFKNQDATPFHEEIQNYLGSAATLPSDQELLSIYNWMTSSQALPPYIKNNQYSLKQNINSRRITSIPGILSAYFTNSTFYDFSKPHSILPIEGGIGYNHIGVVTGDYGGVAFFYYSHHSKFDDLHSFWDGWVRGIDIDRDGRITGIFSNTYNAYCKYRLITTWGITFTLHGMERGYSNGQSLTMTGSISSGYSEVNFDILPTHGNIPMSRFKIQGTPDSEMSEINVKANGTIDNWSFITGANGSTEYYRHYGFEPEQLDSMYLSRYIALGPSSQTYSTP